MAGLFVLDTGWRRSDSVSVELDTARGGLGHCPGTQQYPSAVNGTHFTMAGNAGSSLMSPGLSKTELILVVAIPDVFAKLT